MPQQAAEPPAQPSPPRIVVLGLGPAGPELVPAEVASVVAGSSAVLRTSRHPASAAFPGLPSLDHLYESSDTFEEVYAAIVETLVHQAQRQAQAGARPLAYLVPGSPMVAERSVQLLRHDRRVEVEVHPAPSFLELAWDRLDVDPVREGVQLLDATGFPEAVADATGPVLLCQCWSQAVLSEIKLAAGDDPAPPGATVLHHLGLADERVVQVPWAELDRLSWVDHLTSVWVPQLASPLGRAMVALEELGSTLRRECPWDREQTHRSLRRHVIEEAYEVVDAIDELDTVDDTGTLDDTGSDLTDLTNLEAVEHLREELGDLLFQVVIHARLATEDGWFTLAEVASGIHDKLVRRHPHVFGTASADTPEQVATSWEQLKSTEKNRSSALDGVVWQLPALTLADELLRKAGRAGLADVAPAGSQAPPVPASPTGADPTVEPVQAVGRWLWALCEQARALGVDPELALREEARRFDRRARAAEAAHPAQAHNDVT